MHQAYVLFQLEFCCSLAYCPLVCLRTYVRLPCFCCCTVFSASLLTSHISRCEVNPFRCPEPSFGTPKLLATKPTPRPEPPVWPDLYRTPSPTHSYRYSVLRNGRSIYDFTLPSGVIVGTPKHTFGTPKPLLPTPNIPSTGLYIPQRFHCSLYTLPLDPDSLRS